MRQELDLYRLYKPGRFFAVDFILTWGPLWLMVAGLRKGFLEDGTGLLVLAGISAVISSLYFLYRSGNSAFIRDYWRRIFDFKRIGPMWWVVILFAQGAINIMAILVSTLFGMDLAQLHISSDFLAVPLAFTVFIFFFGPLPEEMGWRGYGLDALRSRMNLLRASLLMAVIWGLWHLPLVFIPGSFQNSLAEKPLVLASFFLAFIPGSILMSWIYYRTRRSTLSAIMFHFAGNFSGEVFNMSSETRIIQTVLACLVAAVVLWHERAMFGERDFWVDFEAEDKEARKRWAAKRPAWKWTGGLILLSLLLLASPLCGASELNGEAGEAKGEAGIGSRNEVPVETQDEASGETEADSPSAANGDRGEFNLTPLPFAFYTSDTGFAAGGMLNVSRIEGGEETAGLYLSSTYTQNKQWEVNLSGEGEVNGGRLKVTGELRYSNFPSLFYGFAAEERVEESYVERTFETQFSLLRRIFWKNYAGPFLRVSASAVEDYPENGRLADYVDRRGAGSAHAGLGIKWLLDGRDRLRYPRSGYFMEMRSLYFFPVGIMPLETDGMPFNKEGTDFLQLQGDLRAYLPLGDGTLAARLSTQLGGEGAPLGEKADLGGLFILRGYPERRFVNNNSMAAQAKLRIPLVGRLSGVLFSEAGTVAGTPGELFSARLRYCGGFGLRYDLNERGTVKLRLDYGLSSEGGRLYITILDAF